MRWLFLFVLALNLAYIGIEMSRSSSDDYANVPPLKNVKSIVLLSELKPLPNLAEVEQVVGEEKLADELPVKKSPDEQDVVGAEAMVVEVGQAVGAQGGVESVSAKKTDPEQPAVKPKDEAEKIQKKLATPEEPSVAENAATVAPANTAQNQTVDSPQTPPAQSASCFTLGPFRDLGKLRGLTREIKSYVVNADFRGSEEKEPTLYWVYVKPEKNRSQAIRAGKRLKAKKIKDFYVIRDGEKINGLSLGYFRNKKSAYRLAKKVRKLGFDVAVEQVLKTHTIYWLDYRLADGATIPAPVLEKYTRSGKKEKITRLSRDCGS